MHKKKEDEDEEAVNKVPRKKMDYFVMSEEDSESNKKSIIALRESLAKFSGSHQKHLRREKARATV